MIIKSMLMGATFSGTRVAVSEECYEMVPIFPDKPRTKRRMRRTRGRFGRVERMNPLAYKTPYGLVIHPILYERLKFHSTRCQRGHAHA